MNNIISVITQTASNTLVEKLNELDIRKKALESRLLEINSSCENKMVSSDELKIAFGNARQMLESKELPNIKVLIERFVHKIIINGENIEIQFILDVGSRVTNYPASIFTKRKTPQPTREDDVVMFLFEPTWLATCGGEGFGTFERTNLSSLVFEAERKPKKGYRFPQAERILNSIG